MGRPKALLEFEGQTFLERILETIAATSIRETVVVLGHDRDVIVARNAPRKWVFNANYELGMISSFQAGIRALPDGVTSAVLFLVDHPLVTPHTVDRLLARAAEGVIVVPVAAGRRGHPVVFGSKVLEEVLALPAGRGANEVVHAEPSRVIEVAIQDVGVTVDVDTPEEFERLSGSR